MRDAAIVIEDDLWRIANPTCDSRDRDTCVNAVGDKGVSGIY
jgi:hypothetical protein